MHELINGADSTAPDIVEAVFTNFLLEID